MILALPLKVGAQPAMSLVSPAKPFSHRLRSALPLKAGAQPPMLLVSPAKPFSHSLRSKLLFPRNQSRFLSLALSNSVEFHIKEEKPKASFDSENQQQVAVKIPSYVVFWSLSILKRQKMCKHLRIEGEDEDIANDPLKAIPRDDIIKHVKYAIPMNLFGLVAIIRGMRGKFGLVYPGYVNCDPESIVECRTGFLQGS